MRILKRHFFSIFFATTAAVTVFAWWKSSRDWSAHYLETPVGIFRIQSESSMFGVGAKLMMHEHRWHASSNSDPITGDHMKFVIAAPIVSSYDNDTNLLLPFWQVTGLLLLTAGIFLFFEWKRATKIKEHPSPETPPASPS